MEADEIMINTVVRTLGTSNSSNRVVMLSVNGGELDE
jgi:hypothetical protein